MAGFCKNSQISIALRMLINYQNNQIDFFVILIKKEIFRLFLPVHIHHLVQYVQLAEVGLVEHKSQKGPLKELVQISKFDQTSPQY